MPRSRRLLAAAAVLGLSACGPQNPDQDAGAPAAQAPLPEPAAATAPIAMAAADYVAQAGAGDMYEIEASRLALQGAKNAEVKAFAQMMIADHTQSTADLATAISQSGQTLSPPAAMPADRQALLDVLNAAGDRFDAAYLTQQVQAHEQALKLHQSYAQHGDVASLKAFAAAATPVGHRHHDPVRQRGARLVVTTRRPAGGAATSTPAAAAP
ncbi:MAG: DUF4142 domain-containing protein, partial [Phenylobacterium sp.]